MNRTIAILIAVLAGIVSSLSAEGLGLALSGGGARGFAHIGMLKVLDENEIYPDYISGTSVGAIVGALYAMGYSAREIEEFALSVDWSDVFEDSYQRFDLYIGQKRWAPYGNAVFNLGDNWHPKLPQGVYTGNKINYELFRILSSSFVTDDFSQLPIPFACIATDLITGEQKVFQNGSLLHAVRASMSIPSIVEPHFYKGSYYIDGGITQNFPVGQVLDMGADTVIGLKVNSSLYDEKSLNNLIRVLEQTINIGMTKNVNDANDLCDLLFDPGLEEFSAGDYKHIQQLIDAGEQYARQNLDRILSFKERQVGRGRESGYRKVNKLEPVWSLKIDKIRVEGNQYISSAKVKEYVGLDPQRTYTIGKIVQKSRSAWNSQAFELLYPSLEKEDGENVLVINVRERDRKHLAMNFSYDSSDALVAGIVLSLNNYLMKNSIVLAEVKAGGRNEFNLDLVKNFGDLWGIYYRLFPYVNEKKLFKYDEDHYKIESQSSLEYGINTGIGVFANKIAVTEAFVYTSKTNLYRNVSENEPINKEFVISGFGIKGYHESLNDFAFPMSGMRALGKFNFSRSKKISDYIYTRFRIKSELYRPLLNDVSLKISLDWGTFFDRKDISGFDPFGFNLGGAESYLGLFHNEVSATDYKLYEVGLITEPWKKIFLFTGLQGLNYTNKQTWALGSNMKNCGYFGIGYKSVAGPMKYQLSIDQNGMLRHYLNLGWTTDIFHFSRQ
ncbi:MAG: patatin-like phospholipase family protein [Candidatus Cloacimonetes bacterium]|nr:patatin-like phospholipase family protein [Candidatus Cloacimonadota bacterium]